MTTPPRRKVEPLAPPPGQFDEVFRAARYRRRRRVGSALTVATVFFGGVAGGLALDRPASPTDLIEAARDFADLNGDAPVDTTDPSTAASRKAPKQNKSKQVTSAPAPTKGRVLRGVAVGSAGQPAAGMWVYPVFSQADGFVPTFNAAAVTAADGSFSIPCPGTPVLLAPWPLNGQAKSKARRATWQATFVGGASDVRSAAVARCGKRPTRTIVQHGATVTGQVSVPAACSDPTLSLYVWVHGNPRISVKVQDLSDGDEFRVGGLPAGRHLLGRDLTRAAFIVGSGTVAREDFEFACGPVPSPTVTGGPSTPPPSPTPTPTSPTPTKSETPLPTPSETTPEPDPSGPTASPSST